MSKTLSSVIGNKVPTSIFVQDGNLTGLRRDMTMYDNDTTAKVDFWGPRFSWASSSTTPITTTWTDMLSLTAPGVLEFFGGWLGSGTSNEDVNVRILIDGTQALLINNFKVSAADTKKGFVLVGDSQVSGASFATGDTKIFDSLPFETECKIQIQAKTLDVVGDVYKMMYRYYQT